MNETDTSSPTEQVLKNIDFRINSLSHILKAGIATQNQMTPVERRREIRRRRQVLASEVLRQTEQRHKSVSVGTISTQNEMQQESTHSEDDKEDTKNDVPPTLSEASANADSLDGVTTSRKG